MKYIYIYIYIYNIKCYLIDYEYFNNLNGDRDMVGTSIIAGMGMETRKICTSSYLIEKVRDSPYPYTYPVNARILRQNGDGSGNTHEGEFICHP